MPPLGTHILTPSFWCPSLLLSSLLPPIPGSCDSQGELQATLVGRGKGGLGGSCHHLSFLKVGSQLALRGW